MRTETAEIVGDNIRMWLFLNHDTISKMADGIQMSRATLTELKAGRSKMIQFKTLEAIASYFNVSVPELVTKHHLGVS
ncbi:helix-turn-helix transcriptional regulator [Lactiplantibacillus plantarum]|uniref:Helix-turn-helix transcriptional regulator n=1 Tax=Lactiplantibacillus plantarum TaxID=1590 RepID=A0AAX1K7T6_LACPN|nr:MULTISPECIES: helix-turn-helix transcriptional regulator [Lactiplantibacillus]MCB4211791.1 helix-turn-helix transcriptional regulator [Lactiplantibacillus plantarum]MCT3329533.1 XRE family transcriptional regulator [Lactiplantibacillus pentosus]MEA0994060.1 helix-turn-helix transcriptional regulator [Lactiplantibacillus plantarum]MEA1033123.1 helix-turn-helix transcriptional regulator [Lactiplantibacillus plantarum]QQM60598.1 helix-turn-helix transcriptional regulator [Lactiplantibacillus p